MTYEEKYKQLQRERKRASDRKYYESHKDKMRAYHKAWIAAHPDYRKQLRAKRKNGRNNDELQD